MLRRVRDAEGFTLIEVLVAAIVLTLGSLAVFTVFASGIKNVQRGRETQIGVSVAQREMEKVHSLKFSEVLLMAAPETSAEVASPAHRVSSARTEYNLNRTGATNWAKLAVAGTGETGAVEPKSETFSVGGAPVTVYRYVVWRKDEAFCKTFTSTTEPTSCKEGKNYKRVIIDVWPGKVGNQASRHGYYELQSDFVEPGGS
ncbi:MAG TPA: prepilin-type N-terminal cleavage/methylation domain-containing protein [Solirubrobacterales bacterium]|nr:prepilin-type N-terminal cleavage/methylation domain-containing protein [Solirubrobacterales bacterium]